MNDYLERLIKRTSGQVPVIKPLVRPGYGTLPLINEPATEFEETVTFDENAGSQVLRRQTPPASPVKATPVTTESNAGETKELVKRSEDSEVKIPDTRLRSTRRTNKQPARFSPETKTAQRKTKERIPEADTPEKQRTQVQPKQDTGRDIEVVERLIAMTGRRDYAIENVPVRGRIDTSQPAKTEMQEAAQVMLSQDNLKENEPPREPETEEPPEATHAVNLVWRYKPEMNSRHEEIITSGAGEEKTYSRPYNPPSMNIRVTIGRVEVKAVPPPERQIRRTPAAPREPAITLDAYLKGRDEEAR